MQTATDPTSAAADIGSCLGSDQPILPAISSLSRNLSLAGEHLTARDSLTNTSFQQLRRAAHRSLSTNLFSGTPTLDAAQLTSLQPFFENVSRDALASRPRRRYSRAMNDFVRGITTGETKRMKTSAMITITGIIIRWPVGPGVL